MDNFLCSDLTNASGIFQRVAGAIARRVKSADLKVVPYLDDFILIEATLRECAMAQSHLISLLIRLDISIK